MTQRGRRSASPPWLGVAGMVAIGTAAILAWLGFVGDRSPGFNSVLDLKIALATLVLILAVVQVLMAALFYGWVPSPGIPNEATAFLHRWSGRVLAPVAFLVLVYCVRDIGAQSTPTRAAIHTVLGSAVFIVLAAKLIILRGVPRLSSLLPVLGVATSLLFIGIWMTSAMFVIRTRAQGYGNADVGATVDIVSDPQTVGRFEPALVSIRPGQAVAWRNRANAPHNVVRVGGGFDSGLIAEGGSFRWPAKAPQTLQYRCTIHPDMPIATIVVEDK